MQLKNTEGPSQGSLPPRVTEAPPNPRYEVVNTNRGQTLLRHRCPLSCSHHSHSHSHSHSTSEGPHRHHSNSDRRQDTADTRQHNHHHNHHNHHNYHHHHHHYNSYQPSPPQSPSFQPQYPQQVVPSGHVISRGVTGSGVAEYRVLPVSVPSASPPPRPSPGTQRTLQQQPLIPVDFRRRAIKYMSTRLQVGVDVEEQSVREIERRILTLEEQVYESSVSQDEYVSKLASRLAAILQHLDKCRTPRTPPVPHQSQQEPVM